MVKCLNAAVADTAVGTAWRTVELASGAPLHAHSDAIDLHILVEGKPEVIILLLVRLVFGDDAGVHECGQREVDENKKCDNTLDNRDAVVVAAGQFRAREHEKQGRRRKQQRPCTCCRYESRLRLAFGHFPDAVTHPDSLVFLKVDHESVAE